MNAHLLGDGRDAELAALSALQKQSSVINQVERRLRRCRLSHKPAAFPVLLFQLLLFLSISLWALVEPYRPNSVPIKFAAWTMPTA